MEPPFIAFLVTVHHQHTGSLASNDAKYKGEILEIV